MSIFGDDPARHGMGAGPALVEKSLLVAHQMALCVAHIICATDATPLVKYYSWRITICATHNPPFSCAYRRCAINRLCVVHIAICATDTICATSSERYAPLTFRTGLKNRYFLVFIHNNTQKYKQVYSITVEYTAIQNNISS
jgi:hypothetical protein